MKELHLYILKLHGEQTIGSEDFLFVWVEALHPIQFFRHVRTFSWVEPVLSKDDEVSCSRTQHSAPGEIQTRDLVIKSLALYRANGTPLQRFFTIYGHGGNLSQETPMPQTFVPPTQEGST